MKRFTKPLSLLLAVLILLSSVMVLSAVNIFAAGTITYSFSSTKAGYAQGKISLSGLSGDYDLYWADNTKALTGYRKIATVSGSGSFDMPKYTAIPDAATKLIAVKSGSSTLTVSGAAAVYSISASKQFNSKLLYTFGSISDPQLANQGTSSYPNDKVHLKAALETLAKRAVDFTIVSGDVVNDQNNASYASEYKSYQQILADSSYAAPIYESNGNHDVATHWDNANYNNNVPFIKATGLDSKKATIDAGKPYFEVTEPTTGDHFIFMALEGGFRTNKGTQFTTAQLDWLEGLLKKYNGDGKNIFIIEHANVEGWGSGDKPSAPFYYDLGLNKNNNDVKRFIKLMETYKDCVIITGHTHLQLEAEEPDDKNTSKIEGWVGQYNYSDNNGTSAVMIHNSAIGGVRRLINGSVNRGDVLGLSEGYIVEVYEDAILFNGTNMYYNEMMPQCCYIVPMTTSQRDEADIPTEPDETEPTPTIPASDDITITIKDETGEGWMKNNASEREIQLIDNATGKKYVMTSTDGYNTWQAVVPRSVTDITFKRVRTSNGEVRNQWDAGKRNGSVCYCVLDDAGGGSTEGNGYWDMSLREPTRPVQTEPATKPTTKPVETKPVVTEPKETTAPATKPVVTEPKETTKATEPVVIPTKPVTIPTKPVVTEPKESTTVTEPAKDELEPVIIVEKLSGSNIKVSAYPADDNYDCQYQFAINGMVYQEYSDKSTFVCSAVHDFEYVIAVSLRYSDGDVHKGKVTFNVVNGEILLPEMPEKPTKPTTTTQPVETSTGNIDTVPVTSTTTTAPDYTYVYGDADLNGKINVKDATQVQKHTAKMLTLEGVAYTQADVTGDGKVNIKDATAIQKMVAKIIDKFPVEEVTLVSVSAGTTAKQDLDSYYTYSSYDQYMALKKANKNSASQSEITKLQNALYSIAGATPDNGGGGTDTPTAKTVTVYFENSKNWSTVKIYAWTGDVNNGWPGETMTKESDGKYSYKLDYSKYQSIIFNDGNNNEQTVDISHPGTDKLVYVISGGSGKQLTVTTK